MQCSPTAGSRLPRWPPRRPSRWAPSPRTGDGFAKIGGYFVEEVRRQLVEKFGEKAEDGKNSVYAGGLWVRTSLDPAMQRATTDALRDGTAAL